jgi:hypothetical protein
MQWQFVARNWTWLLSGVGVVAAVAGALILLVPNTFARGLIVGAATVLIIGGPSLLVMQLTGSAPLMMGAQAEVWTAGELRPLRRAGWKVINHVRLRPWDIDHVLVGPGGVIAVETKWSAEGWRVDKPDARLRSAVEQVRANARDLRLWRPELRAAPERATSAVLFLWGGARSGEARPSGVIDIDGLPVVYGLSAAKQWRSTLATRTSSTLTEQQVVAVWRALEDQVRSADLREERNEPPLPAASRIYWTAIATFCAIVAGVLAAIGLFTLLASWWPWLASLAVLVAAGVLARRVPLLRVPSLGWLAGTMFTVIYAATVVIFIR